MIVHHVNLVHALSSRTQFLVPEQPTELICVFNLSSKSYRNTYTAIIL